MIQGVNIESGDKIVLNGVIHTIDSVLMPSDVSISEYLGTHETNFADLYAALVLEGFENALECKHQIYALKYRERERGGVHFCIVPLWRKWPNILCLEQLSRYTLYLQLGLTHYLLHEMMHLLKFWPTCPLLLLMTLTSKVCIDFQLNYSSNFD